MRLIRSGALEPALNLALDEALLRSGEETLRLYAWDAPALSLGFFQRAADFDPPEGFVLVRRPTGGGAIAHTGELTISWIAARRDVARAYEEINDVVTRAVAELAIAVERGTERPAAAPHGLCFDTHTCYDLLAGGRKLFGSAQRRGVHGFLLHGSLVLEPNPLARGAVSLAELLGRPVPRHEMEQRVIAAWGGPLRAAQPTAEEWRAAERLVEERYGNDAWTRRR